MLDISILKWTEDIHSGGESVHSGGVSMKAPPAKVGANVNDNINRSWPANGCSATDTFPMLCGYIGQWADAEVFHSQAARPLHPQKPCLLWAWVARLWFTVTRGRHHQRPNFMTLHTTSCVGADFIGRKEYLTFSLVFIPDLWWRAYRIKANSNRKPNICGVWGQAM